MSGCLILVGKISIVICVFENCVLIVKINQVVRTNGNVNIGIPNGFKISRIAAPTGKVRIVATISTIQFIKDTSKNNANPIAVNTELYPANPLLISSSL